MKLKRDFLDAAFSDLVRECFDWTCQRCGHTWPERKGQDAHCSHFLSRGAGNSVRYNIDNALLLCASCHTYVGMHPDEHTKLFKRIMGPVRYQELCQARRRIFKLSKDDKKEMAKHYRSELARIQRAREQGLRGFVAAVPWQ